MPRHVVSSLRDAVLVIAACAGIALAPSMSMAAEGDRVGPACGTRSSRDCHESDVLAASESDLRAIGDAVDVSCGTRLDERPVDAAYLQSCVERMRTLAADLSAKWTDDLVPIDPGLIRYDWNRDGGCIDFVLGNGKSFGICPVYGVARIPLRWRTAQDPSPPGA